MTTTIKFSKAMMGTVDDEECLVLPLPEYEDRVKARKFVAEQPDKPHVAEIKPHRQKRSLDANAYFWKLCGDLAAKIGVPKEEIYRGYVCGMGDNFDIVPIRDDAKASWIRTWTNRGIAWICEDLGESKHAGYSNVICYKGSSEYDTRQMSCLIDLVIFDCKEQGIETKTPDEIARLKESWSAYERVE